MRRPVSPRARSRACAALCCLAAAAAAACAPGAAARHGALPPGLAQVASGAAPVPLAISTDDPFGGSAELSRDGLVAAVLARNPSLASARAAWRAALARYPQEIALADPMLGYGVAPAALGGGHASNGHRVELRQAVPFPGKLRLRGEIALADAEAAAHDFASAALRLATATSLLFDDLYVAARALEVNAHHRALVADLRAVARSRYESGTLPLGAPLRAELALAALEREASALETERAVLRAQLNALLHRAPSLPLPEPPRELEAAPAAGGDTDPEAALAARPEVRAADARVRAGELAVAAAERAFLPDFAVTAAYDGLWEDSALRPFVGLEVEIPLQLGRRRAAVAEAEALRDRSRGERAAVEAEIRLAVESGARRVEDARRALAIARDRLLPAARDVLDAARLEFESGQETLDAVLTAEEQVRELELEEHRALAELDRRTTELRSAAGALALPGGERP